MKRVYPDKEYCIGCKLCELACLTVHSKTKDLILAYTEERVAGLVSSIQVVENSGTCVALSCRHCDEPACVAVCAAGALSKNRDSGVVEYNSEKCVGCWSCIVSCSYGAIQRNKLTNKIIKCDLCSGRDEGPACVQVCPNRALKFYESPPASVELHPSISSNIEREEINNVLNDIHELLKISKDIKRAVVIGGDVGGLKISESLFNLGLEVAIVEEGERILSRSFDRKASDIMARRIEEVGLRLKCGVSVDEIICGKDGNVRGVLFSDKSFLEAGLIVVDDNVLSNLDFTRKIGAEVRGGLIVSHFTQGSVTGDMSGSPENILINSFIFCGKPMASVGEFFAPENNPGYDVHLFYDEIKQSYRKLIFKEFSLVGYVLVGDIDFAGIFTSFIKFKCKLDAETKNKLCEGSPDILMWPDELFIKEWNP